MLLSFFRQSVTRIRPGTKTSRGSTISDWSSDKVSTLVINGCSVQPSTTSLSQDGRILGIADGMTAYLPAGSDVQSGDRIQFGSDVYTIMGDPRVWPSASGSLDHIELNLERWSG